MRTVILIPWRPDNSHRSAIWDYLRVLWTANHSDYPIIYGRSPDGPFNRSAAINDAAAKADEWDVAIIADADTYVPPTQIEDAIDIATVSGRLIAAFTHVDELSPQATQRLIRTGELPVDRDVQHRRTNENVTRSNALAVPRCLWDRVGGFDDKFVGWSAEDEAAWWSCKIIAGDPLRIDGPAYHFWHPSAKPNWRDVQYQMNQERWRRYAKATTEAEIIAIRNS